MREIRVGILGSGCIGEFHALGLPAGHPAAARAAIAAVAAARS